MRRGNFEELKIWQIAKEISIEIYKLTQRYPNDELFGIVSQMRRCAISIPSNVAEGHGRGTSKEFVRFLDIARGSLAELKTQVIISHDLGYLDSEIKEELKYRLHGLDKMIVNLIEKLECENN